mgnify:CR=1 FL=1
MKIISKILKDKFFILVFFKYFAFVIKALKGLLIAKFLGPYFMGVWGFMLMIEDYLAYTGFGIQSYLSVELAKSTKDNVYQKQIMSQTISGYVIIFIFILLLYPIYVLLGNNFGGKYLLGSFLIYCLINTGLHHLQRSFFEFYRVAKKFSLINFSEIVTISLPLLAFIFFKNEQLIWAMYVLSIFAYIISLLIFFYYLPFKIKLIFKLKQLGNLISKGFPFLIYNLSFALIALSGKTIVSLFYLVKEMGYFSFAVSITAACLLGIKTVQWAILPSLISRYNNMNDKQEVLKFAYLLEKINSTVVIFFVMIVMIILPALFIFFPEYLPSYKVMIYLFLNAAVLSMGMGFGSYIIVKNKQIILAKYSIFIFILITLINLITSQYLNLSFEWIAIGQILGSMIFIILQRKTFHEISGNSIDFFALVTTCFPLKVIIPMIIFALGMHLEYSILYFIAGLFLFTALNYKNFFIINSFIKERYKVKNDNIDIN